MSIQSNTARFLLTLFIFLFTPSQLLSTDIENSFWPPQVVRWRMDGDKELIFIATHHSNDLKSPIHATIRDIFEKENPDIYIMEGFSSDREGISPDRLKKKSTDIFEKTGECGENLYAAYLATKANIPFIGAELPEDQNLELLKKKGFSFEDIVFYLLVQHLPYFFRDGDFETHTQQFTPLTWESMCNQLMQKTIAGWLNQDVKLTYQDFLQWWENHFHSPLDMQKEFGDWLRGTHYSQPNKSKEAPYTQQIAYWWHKNRDDHIIGIIKAAVTQNKKTLVVFGSNHLRDLWERLIETYGEPASVMRLPNEAPTLPLISA
jgi:hypothetical protein